MRTRARPSAIDAARESAHRERPAAAALFARTAAASSFSARRANAARATRLRTRRRRERKPSTVPRRARAALRTPGARSDGFVGFRGRVKSRTPGVDESASPRRLAPRSPRATVPEGARAQRAFVGGRPTMLRSLPSRASRCQVERAERRGRKFLARVTVREAASVVAGSSDTASATRRRPLERCAPARIPFARGARARRRLRVSAGSTPAELAPSRARASRSTATRVVEAA